MSCIYMDTWTDVSEWLPGNVMFPWLFHVYTVYMDSVVREVNAIGGF